MRKISYFLITLKSRSDRDEISVYAAQTSFFMILTIFPFTLLLITIIQLIPALSGETLLSALNSVIPLQFRGLAQDLVNDLFTKSPKTIVSVTYVTALWSTTKGMHALEVALNRIWQAKASGNFFLQRLFSISCTLLFLVIIVSSMLLLVLGDTLLSGLAGYFTILSGLILRIMKLRFLFTLAILLAFFTFIYTYFPQKKLTLKSQLPGACFTALIWLATSRVFSVYFQYSTRYSYMYGSLTAVALVLLWLYTCFTILLIGAEINALLTGSD